MRKKFILVGIGAAALVTTVEINQAEAATLIDNLPGASLNGIDQHIFTSYSGTISSLDIDLALLGLGSGKIDTGSISLNLDSKLISSFEINYDTSEVTGIYNLIGKSKNLSDAGIPQVSINLTENGTIESITKGTNLVASTGQWSDIFDGTFTQDGGVSQHFTGTGKGMSNFSFSYPFGVKVTTLTIGAANVSIDLPGATDSISIGSANNNNQNQVIINVPEPLTILGTATALGFGVLFKKRQPKNS